jgi:hypothetical protein
MVREEDTNRMGKLTKENKPVNQTDLYIFGAVIVTFVAFIAYTNVDDDTIEALTRPNRDYTMEVSRAHTSLSIEVDDFKKSVTKELADIESVVSFLSKAVTIDQELKSNQIKRLEKTIYEGKTVPGTVEHD